jgi:hypothetical protein
MRVWPECSRACKNKSQSVPANTNASSRRWLSLYPAVVLHIVNMAHFPASHTPQRIWRMPRRAQSSRTLAKLVMCRVVGVRIAFGDWANIRLSLAPLHFRPSGPLLALVSCDRTAGIILISAACFVNTE